jgi:hypothetical protein
MFCMLSIGNPESNEVIFEDLEKLVSEVIAKQSEKK